MKIENNGISPLNSQKPDATQRLENQITKSDLEGIHKGRDKAELSSNARLLSKARSAYDSVKEVENERLAMIKQQVESGDYTVQVEAIARRLAGQFFIK